MFHRISFRNLVPTIMEEHYSNPVGRLQEHCQAMAESSPMYQLLITEGPCHSPIFTMQVLYQGFSATGSGTSKKEAKSKAAQAMLRLIQWGEEEMQSRSTQGLGRDGVCMNVVSKLQEQSVAHKLGLPVYQAGVYILDFDNFFLLPLSRGYFLPQSTFFHLRVPF